MVRFILELRTIWKQRSEMEKVGASREDETMFVPSISVLECKFYTKYTLSGGSADQYLLEILQYEAN